MKMLEEGGSYAQGEALVAELAGIHRIIRENLAALRAVTEMVVTGVAPAELQAEVRRLAATNVVWTLRNGCLRYCSLVHSHHGTEDALLFPGLRRVNPDLRAVIDKLEADHVAVSVLLDQVETAAKRVIAEEGARATLAAALNNLAEHMLTHLDYEEENLNPTLRRLTAWPLG